MVINHLLIGMILQVLFPNPTPNPESLKRWEWYGNSTGSLPTKTGPKNEILNLPASQFKIVELQPQWAQNQPVINGGVITVIIILINGLFKCSYRNAGVISPL